VLASLEIGVLLGKAVHECEPGKTGGACVMCVLGFSLPAIQPISSNYLRTTELFSIIGRRLCTGTLIDLCAYLSFSRLLVK